MVKIYYTASPPGRFMLPFQVDLDIKCKGQGIKGYPFIMDQWKIFHRLPGFELRNSNSFIEVHNIDPYEIGLKNCQNITVKNCVQTHFRLFRSSKIKYLNSKIKKKCVLSYSSNILFENSSIGKLRLEDSDSIIFKNCTIQKYKKLRSNIDII